MAKIVVVEDEADIAMLVRTKFRNAGHEVMVAGDGESGLALIIAERPDVVLLDVMMPKMNGFSVCSSVREHFGPVAPPVIVLLSARSQLSDRQRGVEAGCDDYVTKPFAPSELLERVMKLLERPKANPT
jgi:DNA-binding response OmpR family regulator